MEIWKKFSIVVTMYFLLFHAVFWIKTSLNLNDIKHLTDYDHWLIKPQVLFYMVLKNQGIPLFIAQ
jgi:hypothetical protein